jgi:hypothetical protein
VAMFGPVVVHEADRVDAQVRMGQQLLDDQLTCGPCSGYDGPPGAVATSATASAPDCTQQNPGEGAGCRAQQRIHEQHRKGNSDGREPRQGKDGPSQNDAEEAGEPRSYDQTLQLQDARVTPEPPVETGLPIDEELERKRDNNVDGGGIRVDSAPFEPLEPERKGHNDGRAEKTHV